VDGGLGEGAGEGPGDDVGDGLLGGGGGRWFGLVEKWRLKEKKEGKVFFWFFFFRSDLTSRESRRFFSRR